MINKTHYNKAYLDISQGTQQIDCMLNHLVYVH